MARFVVLGGGVAGHTAATFAKKWLGDAHEVIVVTPNSHWNWIPSNIWVGVGKMSKKQVVFALAPVYQKAGVDYRQAKAISIHPEGKEGSDQPFVTIEYTGQGKEGQSEEIAYDYLLNATGPKLNFDATPGLGDGHGQIGEHTVSVCTADHAIEASKALKAIFEKARNGQRQRILVGTGHGTCTCHGAAFEYVLNVEHEARQAGVREHVDIEWISNEPFLGDFGMDGIQMGIMGYVMHSKSLGDSLFAERGIHWQLDSHVSSIESGKLTYEQVDGTTGEKTFDFAMLIPPFSGVGLKAYDQAGKEITDRLFAPNGFLKVDADYTPKPYEEWKASDWPKTYRNPDYPNIFAAGIAFAPPHPISKPRTSPNGTPITPMPPRTGMPSGTIAKAVARSVVSLIQEGEKAKLYTASMAEMGAICVASAGTGFRAGQAVGFTMYPLVRDFETYPGTGRDTSRTYGEIGVSNHWIKYILHHLFLWKAKLKPGWTLIPE